MSIWIDILWLILGLGLIAYALTGGADLGAGLWTLLARGPRRVEQQKLVKAAIAPIWEANHVWLIFVIVVLFTAFPRAFAAISIALHIPIGLTLIGLVFRGAAFSFEAYGIQADRTRVRWISVFSWSSLVTPFFMGTIIGALSSGEIRIIGGQVTTGFVAGWTRAFAVLAGVFTLSLFALLAAVYLAAEAKGEVREDFRRRALAMEVVAGLLSAGVLLLAREQAPPLYGRLLGDPWLWLVQAVTALLALLTCLFLWFGRFGSARLTAPAQVAMVIIGWGVAMDGHFILPDVALTNAGAQPAVLPAVTLALAIGALLLGPALWYLFYVFKSSKNEPRR
jgi:cytochrome d ubiquinol oxidase subunit II